MEATKQTTRQLTLIEGNTKPIPDRIISTELEDELKYKRGVDVPQTVFDVWDLLRNTCQTGYNLMRRGGYTLDNTTEAELKDLQGIIEICDKHRTANYPKSKRALLVYLEKQGVTVSKRELDYFYDE